MIHAINVCAARSSFLAVIKMILYFSRLIPTLLYS